MAPSTQGNSNFSVATICSDSNGVAPYKPHLEAIKLRNAVADVHLKIVKICDVPQYPCLGQSPPLTLAFCLIYLVQSHFFAPSQISDPSPIHPPKLILTPPCAPSPFLLPSQTPLLRAIAHFTEIQYTPSHRCDRRSEERRVAPMISS